MTWGGKMIHTLDDFIQAFQRVQARGWIQTHRSGPTGIGKTLEDLLGIPENNAGEPDFGVYELKSARSKSNSMLTLFTLAPQPKKANAYLLAKYGYIDAKKGKLALRTTLSTDRFANIQSKHSMKMTFVDDRIYFESELGIEQVYYETDSLLQALRKKYAGELVYAYAEHKGSKANEHFKFHSAYTATMNYEHFLDLLRGGVVKIDIRLGLYPDGKTHDHGTAFRISPRDQDALLLNKRKIV